ncbi:UDP-N-acetylglucosamine--N-acetylmuramyl-(pentapeptide) pyrophosphoryl-undecaprenol N-acetylglucosamine transferase [Anaerolinea thermophila]|uniref:UDP-N-acetylglucosamine--N-acetylmuramyl- (pentapeptide) pyrophosphoryl-undecaprenol N-acetylglucosamine transferase n=1 Tax=Anaerolinea thermophila TaxID=167964 RepID=UPI0006741C9C|nr:UDP-N-acetylglucosamine--N-acetylmuramyl-(pentapeptide) pyrophosphoryl-undecaprenol N-acetylglucosamine transferase [Anaerolinea thermophila]
MYPALSILQALKNEANPVLWVGGEGGMEAELVKKAGLPYTAIPAAGVHGVGLRALPGNILRLARGVLASRRILKEFQPEVLLFTGGYLAVPMALAGRHIPSLLYVPDIEPGLALKTLSRFASTIALTAEPSRTFFKHSKARVEVTGYPVRQDLLEWNRERGAEKLGLDAQQPILLVTGGSKGARSINRAIVKGLPELLQVTQICHLTGALDWEEVQMAREALSPDLQKRYFAAPYLHEMGAALACADLVISRAGASTLGEYPLFGLPAILVPYPYAWRYQKVNAMYLVEQGAAVMIENQNLAEQLVPTVLRLIGSPEKLAAMRKAMRTLHRPQAAERIASLVLALAQPQHGDNSWSV